MQDKGKMAGVLMSSRTLWTKYQKCEEHLSNQIKSLLITQGEILWMQQQTVHIVSYIIDNKIE